MTAIALNSTPYVLPATTTAASQTLAQQDIDNSLTIVLKNSGTVPVFAYASEAAETAVFPVSTTLSSAVYPAPTSSLRGTIVLGGCVESLSKGKTDKFINFIASSGSATVYAAVGNGE